MATETNPSANYFRGTTADFNLPGTTPNKTNQSIKQTRSRTASVWIVVPKKLFLSVACHPRVREWNSKKPAYVRGGKGCAITIAGGLAIRGRGSACLNYSLVFGSLDLCLARRTSALATGKEAVAPSELSTLKANSWTTKIIVIKGARWFACHGVEQDTASWETNSSALKISRPLPRGR